MKPSRTRLNTLLALLVVGLTACDKPAEPPAAGDSAPKSGKKRKIVFVTNGVASF